jgi:hypothetical protein
MPDDRERQGRAELGLELGLGHVPSVERAAARGVPRRVGGIAIVPDRYLLVAVVVG